MEKKKSYFTFRLNFIFFTVFALFSILILRLGFVQIVYGENYKRELERKEDYTISNPVPRGIMFDRNYKVIVENIPKNAITFTNLGITQKKMLETSQRLSQLINKSTEKVTDRDKRDFWLLKFPTLANAKISKTVAQLYKAKKITDSDFYELKVSTITDKELKQLTNHDLEVLAIYREMSKSSKFTTQIIKNNGVTQKEDAIVSENLQFLPGIDTTTDWERSYKFENTLRSVLGTVTKSEEGLPREQLEYFLSRGFSRNDRVGKSYLEMQYNEILNGHKSKVKNITDNDGNTLETQEISVGHPGKNLVLSIDMDLQRTIEKIIEEELMAVKKFPETNLLDRAYVVLMDPHTGEVLTMAGKRMVKNNITGKKEMEDDALGTFTTTYNVGSTVKGATILTGFKSGAIRPNTYFDDKGLKIKGTPLKKSYMYLGNLNEVNALKKSSNVYMFHTAIRIGKGHYEYDQPLILKEPHVFEKIRNSFASFGLGTRTGIDLPNEQIGFKGTSRLPGFLLDLVIGQYDTYSAMQLAQYVSTIANGGYRMQPHLVKEIREPLEGTNEIGPIVKEIRPKVLNSIDMKKEWLYRVHKGFEKVMQEPGGTAYKFFGNAPYYPAGKTGTAEAFYDGPERNKFGKEPPPVINLSLVGYAPSQNPEIAMAVLVPWAYKEKEDNKIALKIGRRVMDSYFEIKKRH
ncbi:MAG: penicillin-binding protein 2 [Bacillota bacterium]|nr:penicillin-binding protein 2 [Bacillota bacterium]